MVGMKKNVLQFLIDALMSSQVQINAIDKQFNPQFGGHLGKQVALIARCVKECSETGTIHLETYHFEVIHQIAEIISLNTQSNIIFKLIAKFLDIYSNCLKTNTPHSVAHVDSKESCLTDPYNLNLIGDSCITISDSDNEENCDDFEESSNPFGKHFKKSLKWMLCWRQSLHEILNHMSEDTDYTINDHERDTQKDYCVMICEGFVQSIHIALSDMEESNDPEMGDNELIAFASLTNIIEKIASNKYERMEKFYIVNGCPNKIKSNGFINPIVQVLATSLRAILEAIKFQN